MDIVVLQLVIITIIRKHGPFRNHKAPVTGETNAAGSMGKINAIGLQRTANGTTDANSVVVGIIVMLTVRNVIPGQHLIIPPRAQVLLPANRILENY